MPYRIELPQATLKSVPKQDIVQQIRSSNGSSIVTMLVAQLQVFLCLWALPKSMYFLFSCVPWVQNGQWVFNSWFFLCSPPSVNFYTQHMKVAFFLVLSSCQTFECETCCIVTCLQVVLRRLVLLLLCNFLPSTSVYLSNSMPSSHDQARGQMRFLPTLA